MRTYKDLVKISDTFFNKCRSIIKRHPWIVCSAMHEYYRNLYPVDTYIEFDNKLPHTERLYDITRNLIIFLDSSKVLGYYNHKKDNLDLIKETKALTGDIYGKIWGEYKLSELIDDTETKIISRLKNDKIDVKKLLNNSKCIDVGCGSGRYSLALKNLGCKTVNGIDYGENGLKIAEEIKKYSGIEDVTFQKGNVLDLPYESDTFNFVFCNGVLHHTEDLEKGVSELIRVARPNTWIFIYLYGDGGIFWYARKKMNEMMKLIPQEYTHIFLYKLMNMPNNRMIFSDNWYVPIETHTSNNQVIDLFDQYKVKEYCRLTEGPETDLTYASLNNGEEGEIMWGDGDIRYLFKKP
jgi:ubiquinone/menaquinone biosynthesis C-methylase UbiE